MSNDSAEIFDPLLNCLQHVQDAAHIATTEVAILRAVVRERYLDFLEHVHQAHVSLRQARSSEDWWRILKPLWAHKVNTALDPLPPLPKSLPDRESADKALQELEAYAQKVLRVAENPPLPIPATAGDIPLTPGKGLKFLPGMFDYRGHEQRLGGKPLEVLRALAAAPGKTLKLRELQDKVWSDCDTGEETVRCAVMIVRKALRKAMTAARVKGPADPIPVVDRGPNRTAWRLDLP